MRTVIIYNKKPNEIMEIVRSLREDGLKQGTDFEFKYMPAKFNDDFSYRPVREEQTEFIFSKDKHATFFTLKYL